MKTKGNLITFPVERCRPCSTPPPFAPKAQVLELLASEKFYINFLQTHGVSLKLLHRFCQLFGHTPESALEFYRTVYKIPEDKLPKLPTKI